MKNRKIEILVIALFLIIQSVIYVFIGKDKSYIHMDEAYSLGLASYKRTEIQDNEDFYGKWHSKEYYEDYLAVQEDEINNYSQVYENQKNDVHPPLYYLILRIAMGFNVGHFSKWPGIIVNIIIYLFITIFMYLILQKLFKNYNNPKEKSIILAFISSITIASITNALYIRMYALSTLNILITTFLHMKLLEKEKIDIKLLIFIGLSALIGSLTHYYYLFYLAMMFLIFVVIYIKEKQYKKLVSYITTIAIAGTLSLIIFPYSIQHMFFGYRGQGVIGNLSNPSIFINNIKEYIDKVNYYGFNNLLNVTGISAIVLAIIYLIKIIIKPQEREKRNRLLKLIELPTIFYFILVAIASPWIELRYIMPVCGLIFSIIVYYVYSLLTKLSSQKITNIVVGILLIAVLIMPFIFKIEPEVLFSDKHEIVEKLENELNIPTVYLLSTENNRFLDDILLFSKINESYVAKDIEYTQENIQKILEGKDISRGIILFLNEGQDNDGIIKIVEQALDFTKTEHLKRLNACDVYYISNK